MTGRPGRRRDVDHRVGQPADVGPGEAPGVAQVDVGGLLAVEPQRAAARAARGRAGRSGQRAPQCRRSPVAPTTSARRAGRARAVGHRGERRTPATAGPGALSRARRPPGRPGRRPAHGRRGPARRRRRARARPRARSETLVLAVSQVNAACAKSLTALASNTALTTRASRGRATRSATRPSALHTPVQRVQVSSSPTA